MNIANRFRWWIATKAVGGQVSNLALVPRWLRHSWMFPAFRTLVAEAYKANPTVFACLSVLSKKFPEPELWPWKRTGRHEYEPVENHPLRQLMVRPNPDMGEAELMQFVILYAPLGGNVYLWKQRARAGNVIALWPFHDGNMQPVPGRTTAEGLVAYYVLTGADAGQSNPFGVERFDDLRGVAIPKSDIVHWKWMIDPDQPWRGVGALVASAGDTDTANEVRRFVYSLLKNDATPPFVVNMAEGEPYGEAVAKRLKAQWRQAHGGPNRGVPAFLEYGMTVTRMGFDLRQLNIESLQDGPDAAICAGFGISPMTVGALVGLKHSTYSNLEEANRALAVNTLIPLWRSFASEMQQSMMKEQGYGDITARFDLEQVLALVEDKNAMEERFGRGFDRGGILRAEYRGVLGLPVTPADQVYKEQIGTILVPAGSRRELPPPGDTEPPGEKSSLPPLAKGVSRETREKLRRLAETMRAIRRASEGALADELGRYFERLSRRVVERLEDEARKADVPEGETKALSLSDWEKILRLIFNQQDEDELKRLLERSYLEISMSSWNVLNLALDSVVEFDLTNPAITEVLKTAGTQVQDINDTTLAKLRTALQHGNEQGWSIDDLVRGDETQPGIGDIVTQTYKRRDEAIARTELGRSQNIVAHGRYEAAGVEHVLVFDNGFENSHEFCKRVDGNVVTVEWMRRNPLQHPNCVRAFGPLFNYTGPVFTEEQRWV